MTYVKRLVAMRRIPDMPVSAAGAFALLGAILLLNAMIPSARAQTSPPVPMSTSNAPFKNWYQGFEQGTQGWYDAGTAGPLGWCGNIATVAPGDRTPDDPRPSAGTAYATVTFGACNAFWGGLGVLGGAPYGPGPELALYSTRWPTAGYVTELDVYLDPAWSGNFQGNFAFAGSSPNTLVQYAATIFPTTPGAEVFHTGPHYFINVDAVPGEQALSVLGYRVEDAGWYTLRFIFSDDAGAVTVAAQIDDTGGRVLGHVDSVAAQELVGPFKIPDTRVLNTAEYGSGHVWFFDIALGVDLAIDEHRVRRGR